MKKKYRVRPGSIADYTIMIGQGFLFLAMMGSIYFFMYMLGC